MIVYGIPNCNTVKKALDWLKEHDLNSEFHDFKKKGITEEKLSQWCEAFGWENVLNKKGTTWRKLSPETQSAVNNKSSAIEVLLNNTSAIKRPIIELDGKPVLIGFNEETYSKVLQG